MSTAAFLLHRTCLCLNKHDANPRRHADFPPATIDFYQKTVPDFGPESGPDFRTEKWTNLFPNVGKTMSTSNDETSEGPNAGPNSGPENGTANSQKNTEIEIKNSLIWKG